MSILLLATLVLWCAGYIILWRVPTCRGTRHAPAPDSLSIIIPARNEADNLPTLLQSIALQTYQPAEVIVVDDESTDGTGEIARQAGARVITSRPLPTDWRGKPWACSQGAAAAHSALLLFVDADTRFTEQGLRRILDTYAVHRGVLSVAPYHTVQKPYEQFSAFFNLMTVIGVGAFTALGRKLQPTGLFGPLLLVNRESYERVGGHAVVKSEILENFYLARRFRELDIPMHCYGGKGVFNVRMYPGGLHELAAGWQKAFASGAADTPKPLLILAVAWITGSLLAFLALAATLLAGIPGYTTMWCSVYALFAVQIGFMLKRIGTFRLWTAVAYPVPLIFYLVLFARSVNALLLKKEITWKGRPVPPKRDAKEDRNAD
ncbi:MAG: glycosyltransferase [Candidatus Pacebacteria bacterium]|nr:glycosyltransferase [Candidatus Paceibacterota bacterium]